MSTTNGWAGPPAATLGPHPGGAWHRGDVQKTRSRARTYLLSSSVPPPPTCGPGGLPRSPVRLPSLTAAQRPHRSTPVVSLSFGEPSLFPPGENVRVSGNHRRPDSLPKQPPPSRPPPPSRSSSLASSSSDPSRRRRSGATRPLPGHDDRDHHRRPVYTHFSQQIRPGPKTPPSRPPSSDRGLAASGVWSELRPPATRYGRGSSAGEDGLAVVGRPCRPGGGGGGGCCCRRSPTAVAASLPLKRTELHVFLPSGDPGAAGAGDGVGDGEEEADAESVDEGFMDELDSKISALRLRRLRPKSLPDR